MNRYFIPGEGREGFPERSYARLDQVEPPDVEEAPEIVLAYDAVDAAWPGFERGLLSLEPDPATEAQRRHFWEQRFGPPGEADLDGVDPFDDLPMYRIELTVARDDWLADKLLGAGDHWLEIELNRDHGPEVDVFGGLFMPPVPAHLSHPPQISPHGAALSRLFDMDDWPDAEVGTLETAPVLPCPVKQLLVFDVGQGSASALVCRCGHLVTYYDAGCGVYRNARTSPSPISFCTHEPPVVLLSHWDSDHWAGATRDRGMLGLTWIAPRQPISQKHKAFGNDILKAGGRLLIVPPSPSPISWTVPGQSMELRTCTGPGRNGSGLALVVEDQASQRGWLLTGDADYRYVPPPIPNDLAAVVVPHHGADMGSGQPPPGRSAHPYSRLIYSFGPGNAHGRSGVRHPTAAAIAAHGGAAWPHGAWSPPPPATRRAGQPVLATASHLSIHEDGIVAGWTAPPSLPLHGHAGTCRDVMPIGQN